MARLVHQRTQRQTGVQPVCLAGRSSLAQLRLSSRLVSAEHASIAWTEHGWYIRDLGSRNGTFVNGIRLLAGERVRLSRGDVIVFGDRDDPWVVDSDGPPLASARRVDSDDATPCVAHDDVLAIPDPEQPEACVINGETGWVLERGEESRTVHNGEIVDLPSGRWQLEFPDIRDAGLTTTAIAQKQRPLDGVDLEFRVSQDEEHVEITVVHDEGRMDMPARAFHYLLLTLARARLKDEEDASATEASAGWVYADELASQLRISPEKLNVDVHRARRFFREGGLVDADRLVERRPGQLRLGARRVRIQRI